MWQAENRVTWNSRYANHSIAKKIVKKLLNKTGEKKIRAKWNRATRNRVSRGIPVVTCYISGSFTLTLLTLDRLFGVAVKKIPSFQQYKMRLIWVQVFYEDYVAKTVGWMSRRELFDRRFMSFEVIVWNILKNRQEPLYEPSRTLNFVNHNV